jgi:hypothetical protein
VNITTVWRTAALKLKFTLKWRSSRKKPSTPYPRVNPSAATTARSPCLTDGGSDRAWKWWRSSSSAAESAAASSASS